MLLVHVVGVHWVKVFVVAFAEACAEFSFECVKLTLGQVCGEWRYICGEWCCRTESFVGFFPWNAV